MRSGFRWRQGAGDVARGGSPGARRIAWPRTLAAKRNARLRSEHLRFVHEEARGGVLHCFVLDCSHSMLAGHQLALAKGLLVALFDQARATRSEVALVCFGGVGADVRFGPAVPRWWIERWLAPVGGGGGTPFVLGIETASALLERAARLKPAQQRWLWILSDGRSSGSPSRPASADHVVLVDFEQVERVRIGRCEQIAKAWDGLHLTPQQLIG
ncbi:magnesium chelatase subunit ChlD-like protein [Paraburkholderia steynii]|uniref:Magnesium chelatase subunit ChlD-like protein n=1 Tax=Paraburkholderia steynii TaxID=1245441 RepID=A0A7Z7FJQ0_9BURK|nr:VWA domain-containing protein [Paraburkholderia steynii]SDI65721.1 magnesium chelatase subunit ChlD-like protein [Paraburkholderia steynii]